MSSLAPSWVEWTHWLYGVGQLKVGRGNWKAWATERLRLKRAAPFLKKAQVLTRNGSSKLLLVIACVQVSPGEGGRRDQGLAYGRGWGRAARRGGLGACARFTATRLQAAGRERRPIAPSPRIAQGLELEQESTSNFGWRVVLTFTATLILIATSIPLGVGVGVFELFMKEAGRTIALPIQTAAINFCWYVAVASVLLRLEKGSWASPFDLWSRKNVWLLMLAASAMQAWLVQVLGSLKDGRRRKWLLLYASFWQRMTDQTIAFVIFVMLAALSLLPISAIQTRLLFNESFSTLIDRKIHRTNLLSELYTPGFFHREEEKPANEKPAPQPPSELRSRGGSTRGGTEEHVSV